MRSAILVAPLLAALGVAQHVHYEIQEVDQYVQSMLGEYHQYASLLTDFSRISTDMRLKIHPLSRPFTNVLETPQTPSN